MLFSFRRQWEVTRIIYGFCARGLFRIFYIFILGFLNKVTDLLCCCLFWCLFWKMIAAVHMNIRIIERFIFGVLRILTLVLYCSLIMMMIKNLVEIEFEKMMMNCFLYWFCSLFYYYCSHLSSKSNEYLREWTANLVKLDYLIIIYLSFGDELDRTNSTIIAVCIILMIW